MFDDHVIDAGAIGPDISAAESGTSVFSLTIMIGIEDQHRMLALMARLIAADLSRCRVLPIVTDDRSARGGN